MKVLCELDTRDNQIIPGHENTIASLLRPRFPFEVSNLAKSNTQRLEV